MRMKRFYSVLLTAVLLFSLNSCGMFQKEPEVVELDRIEYREELAVAYYKDGYAHTIGDPVSKAVSYVALEDGTYRACLVGRETLEPCSDQGLFPTVVTQEKPVTLMDGLTIYSKTVEGSMGQKTIYAVFE